VSTGPGVDLRVTFAGVELEHPLVDASGTYDLLECACRYPGDYLADFPYAAYVPKTVTADARTGNAPPRVTETASGMINAIGLENPGIEAFIDQLPAIAGLRQPVLVSVGGNAPEQFAAVIRRLEEALAGGGRPLPRVVGYELNVSCPNVSGGLSIGVDPAATETVTGAVRDLTRRLIVVKLTPNVTDVRPVAAAAVAAGADGLALVNTFRAMVLDPSTLRPFLGNRTGGLCGPAIKPIALRMVAEVAEALPDVPLVGMGGVMTGRDALEFIACGATLVAVGAANFTGLEAPQRILDELRAECAARGVTRATDVRGRALGPAA
jgi:dihydroorotate dehydrogenase (NAD+) catalytic subunit